MQRFFKKGCFDTLDGDGPVTYLVVYYFVWLQLHELWYVLVNIDVLATFQIGFTVLCLGEHALVVEAMIVVAINIE